MENNTEKLSNLFNDITVFVVFELILAVVFAYLIVKVSAKLLPVIAELFPAKLRQWTLNAIPVIRVVVLVGLIFWAIPLIFNVTLQNFFVIAGALSVAIGFAVKDLASAVIAGLIALFEKPYRLGDWVKVGENYGEVITIGMRSFQIRTATDDIVTIPHDRIWSKDIINGNDGETTLMCVARFYLAREQDTDGVADLLRDIGTTSPYLDLDRPVVVVMHNTHVGMTYELKAYPFEPRDQFAFISDLTERGNKALRDAGIASTQFPEGMSTS